MFRKYPILTRVILFLVVPIIGTAFALYGHLTKSLSPVTGELILSGLNSAVNIQFDKQGVPSVIAQSERDAFFAQGYLHASERMWQMETQRRFTQGTASEIFGIATVNSDIWMRTLGLYRAAEQSWQSLSPESKAALTAYADGVNRWLESAEALQPEFQIFNVKPEKWKAVDSLVWQKAFALSLGKNMDEEINRLFALKILSPKQLKTFYPYDQNVSKTYAAQSPLNDIQSFNQFNQFTANQNDLRRQWGVGERFAGSNAWVVSGNHTQSGNPLLANDPHLSIQQPSMWYAVQLQGGKLNAKGMSLVGLPGVILGRNKSIAWGAAALMSDQQDLYVLDIPLDDNKSYLTDSGLKPISYHKETINIHANSPEFLHKAIEPVEIQIRTTELGPIISDTMGFSDLTLALRWSALDSDDNSFDAFYQLQFATNWDEFRHAASFLKSPGIHFVYADKEGNIGSQVAASIPYRGNGNGTLPLEAQTTSNYWLGYVPFEKLPYQFNPESGFIVAANNKVNNHGDYTISHEWAPGLRYQRINQLLMEKIAENNKLNINDMTDIQLDLVDLGAKKLLKILLQPEVIKTIKSETPEAYRQLASDAVDSLVSWDAQFDEKSYESTIYTYWINALNESLFTHEAFGNSHVAGNSIIKSKLLSQITTLQLEDVLKGKGYDWCLSNNNNANTRCHDRVVNSFISAIQLLRKHTRSSDFVKDWKWGNMHHAEYIHKPLGEIKALEGVFKKEATIGGNSNTVNAANSVMTESGGFIQTFGVTFRQVFDFGKGNESLYVLSTGQSGHFMSQHYDDMLEPFINGQYFRFSGFNNEKKVTADEKNTDAKLISSAEAVDRVNVLKLLPAGAK